MGCFYLCEPERDGARQGRANFQQKIMGDHNLSLPGVRYKEKTYSHKTQQYVKIKHRSSYQNSLEGIMVEKKYLMP
jgi:hypothetical protein